MTCLIVSLTRTEVSPVRDVIVVLVSPSSVVTGLFEDVSLDYDWEFVQPQSFSFSKKRSVVLEENREEMSYEGTPVLPPTPQQGSYSSKMENYLDKSDDMKLEVGEIELLMGPEDSLRSRSGVHPDAWKKEGQQHI